MTTPHDEWHAATAAAVTAAGPIAGPELRRAADALTAQLAVCRAAATELSGTVTTPGAEAADAAPVVAGPVVPGPADAWPTGATSTGSMSTGSMSTGSMSTGSERIGSGAIGAAGRPEPDHKQLTTIALRIGAVLSKINPVALARAARTALRELRTPPPGDPVALRTAAAATREIAARIPTEAVTCDDTRIDCLITPAGPAVARAATRALTRIPVALHTIADGLDQLAAAVEDTQRRHRELGSLVSRARGARAVHTDAALAADVAAMTFADAASTARAAAATACGMRPVDALALAAQSVRVGNAGQHDDGVLTPAQLARAAANLTPTVRDTIAAATSPVERAYVLKVVAAGATDADVAAFAAEIHGRDDAWLHQHLSLLDRGGPGPQDRFGAEVDQFDAFTCGTTSLVVTRAEHDPRHALALTRDLEPPYDAADREEFDRRLSAVQQLVHDETNSLWPQRFGTLPGGVTAWLAEHCPGPRWAWRLVDDTSPRVVSAAVRDVVLAVDVGHPVPLLVGGAAPRHYVLAIGHAAGDLLIFEPTSGDVRRVPVADVVAGRLGSAVGFDHLQAVVLPS